MHTRVFSLRLRRKAAALLVPALLSAFAPALAAAQPVGLPDLGDSSSEELSPQLEQRLGDAIMAESMHDPSYIDDPDVDQYLTGIAHELEAGSPLGAHVSRVFGVDDPSINAFTMPGGYIGVQTGLVVATRNESELAGVLAHEMGHVLQRHIARGLVQQKQNMLIMLATMLAALAAATAGSQLPGAAMAFGQAAAIDSQLSFSRDAEREADRTGFQLLKSAGYDVNGMADFFQRLMQLSGMNESTATAFLRDHPLSLERMSDMQNRARGVPNVNRPESADYFFVRAKMRVLQADDTESRIDAVHYFQGRETGASGVEQAAAYYGEALSWLEQKDYDKAAAALEKAQSGARMHFMLSRLAIDIAVGRGQLDQALTLAREAQARWPAQHSLVLEVADVLQRLGRDREVADFLKAQIVKTSDEPEYYRVLATSYSKLGDRVNESRTMAEYYARTGALPTAVEQLQQARSASHDFYVQSQIDARIRDLQRRNKELDDLLKRFKNNG